MAAFRRFEDIEAWQEARALNAELWVELSGKAFGKDFALADQINRSCGSATDNIAEGFDSGSDPEFARFLRYSQRSCSELKSQLYRALDRGHVSPQRFEELNQMIEVIHRKVGSLIHYLTK